MLRASFAPGLHLVTAALVGLLVSTPAHASRLPWVPVELQGLPEARGHRDLAEELGPLAPSPWWIQRPPPLAAEGPGPIVEREVWGYIPYWEMDYGFPRWDLLTIVAWFAASMDATGKITDTNGWGGAATQDLVDEAHANGVLAIVTVTNFSSSEIGTLVNSAANRAKAIESCLALMATHGADGINIDFEFVPSSGKAGFVTFMKELKAAVAAAKPNGHEGHVSLAGPSIDWSGSYDYDQLLIHTDGIMVMAYGYHWKGGSPGPLSPLTTGDLWKSKSIAWTIDDYLTYGGVENRHKVVIGLPFYGNEWPVAAATVPATRLGDGKSIFFNVAHPEAQAQGRLWDDVSKTPYYHVTRNGQLKQVWYDDGESLAHKVAYVDGMDLGGIGIWALGYDEPYADLWTAIEDVLVNEPPPPVDEGPGEEDLGPGPVDEGPVEAEPEPEPQPEPVPDAGPTEPDTIVPVEEDTGFWPDVSAPPDVPGTETEAGPEPLVTGVRQSSLARMDAADEGCAGGRGASGAGWALALVGLALLRRRRLA